MTDDTKYGIQHAITTAHKALLNLRKATQDDIDSSEPGTARRRDAEIRWQALADASEAIIAAEKEALAWA